jgi:hypothetical protein
MSDYMNKYLKYKFKYLKLKTLIINKNVKLDSIIEYSEDSQDSQNNYHMKGGDIKNINNVILPSEEGEEVLDKETDYHINDDEDNDEDNDEDKEDPFKYSPKDEYHIIYGGNYEEGEEGEEGEEAEEDEEDEEEEEEEDFGDHYSGPNDEHYNENFLNN